MLRCCIPWKHKPARSLSTITRTTGEEALDDTIHNKALTVSFCPVSLNFKTDSSIMTSSVLCLPTPSRSISTLVPKREADLPVEVTLDIIPNPKLSDIAVTDPEQTCLVNHPVSPISALLAF